MFSQYEIIGVSVENILYKIFAPGNYNPWGRKFYRNC